MSRNLFYFLSMTLQCRHKWLRRRAPAPSLLFLRTENGTSAKLSVGQLKVNRNDWTREVDFHIRPELSRLSNEDCDECAARTSWLAGWRVWAAQDFKVSRALRHRRRWVALASALKLQMYSGSQENIVTAFRCSKSEPKKLTEV